MFHFVFCAEKLWKPGSATHQWQAKKWHYISTKIMDALNVRGVARNLPFNCFSVWMVFRLHLESILMHFSTKITRKSILKNRKITPTDPVIVFSGPENSLTTKNIFEFSNFPQFGSKVWNMKILLSVFLKIAYLISEGWWCFFISDRFNSQKCLPKNDFNPVIS